MKILLLGDYSNVHATLAEGLRALGHYVVVASDGDCWKNYPRDIDLRRYGTPGRRSLWQSLLDIAYHIKLRWLFAVTFRGFDVVQLINPVFLPLRAERIMPYYRLLRARNKKMYMGAYGMDYYWVRAGLDCSSFRYSDFNFGSVVRTDVADNEIFIRDWLNGPKGVLNRDIAADCDGIPAGLYEYKVSYERYLAPDQRHKLRYIPFPIRIETIAEKGCRDVAETIEHTMPPQRVRFFIGIQSARSAYKGTDVMLRALERVQTQYPDLVEVRRAENVPFAEYCRLMQSSDVILDQLYSYTPAMNALQAMSQGLIAVSGAEPEYYELQEETYRKENGDNCTLPRPIINVLPTEEDVYSKLCYIVNHKEEIPRLKAESRQFVKIFHDYITVAKQYIQFWQEIR